ncbi:MAG: hypothetical protein ABI016_16750 [Chthoniobacterales bacterium]
MNLSFLRFFKKGKGAEGGVAVASPDSSFEKPASERFGKTVMPNSSRIVGLDSIAAFPKTTPIAAVAPPPVAAPAAPRKISLGGNGTLTASEVAPAAEPAHTPAAERTIALPFVDLMAFIPEERLRQVDIDPLHRVHLKAVEIERGMASGRPTISLRSLYQAAPEFFASEVPASDQTEVALPFGKVLEQFTNVQVRNDQVVVETMPELETPFLQVTQEDGKRFGASSSPVAAPEPPAPVVGEKVAAAPVAEKVVAEAKAPAPIRLSLPKIAPPSEKKEPSPALPQAAAAPAPSVSKLSPNGTDASASERVPASCGPSVPTPLPVLEAPPVGRIPFKVSPPSNDLRQPGAEVQSLRPPAEALEFLASAPRIRLPLRNVLRGIPPFQLTGPIDQVPEDAVIEFPFSIVQPQLALGRVALSPAQFMTALPEEFRALIKLVDAETPIGLSLQDVLQNLPTETLQLRGDQVEVEVGEHFETPFSKKAAEDAERLKGTGASVVKHVAAMAAPVKFADEPVAAPEVPVAREKIADAPKLRVAPVTSLPVLPPLAAPPEIASPVPAAPKAIAPPTFAPAPIAVAKPGERSALQVVLDTDDMLDPKAVVAHASQLPGVGACAIVFSDGLSLAGNIPAEYGVDALCAIAPAIMKRIAEQMAGANLGELNGITVYCAKTPVSFFAHRNICLAAFHSAGELAPEIRTRLGQAAHELARTYAQTA